jgi:DNA adenine methylase
MTAFGTSAMSPMSSRAGRMDAIRVLNRRLDKTVIEHRDWREVMQSYDRTETFFFVDPPYLDCKISLYDQWDAYDARQLREVLFALKGNWLLTFNDTPEIRRIFDGCEFKEVSRCLGINNTQETKLYKELLISPTSPTVGNNSV